MIGATLEQYILEIKNTMNGAYLEFYNREFDFFNSVTEVSSIIKPYPKVCVGSLDRAVLKYNIIFSRFST